MIRFAQDSLVEGLLRPFVLIDPIAGIYLEIAAPDWRFAAALVLFCAGLIAGRGRLKLDAAQVRFVIGMVVTFYVWTFAVGNGRYFAFGLLLAGPLTVLAWRQMPGTTAFRSSALVGLIALQFFTVQQHQVANPWGLVRWYDGPGLPVAVTPLRADPAVFLTITNISYSLLVPRFHPRSRWANIAGQVDIAPGSKEHRRIVEMLASDMPKYLVARATSTYSDSAGQPGADLRSMFGHTLAARGLAMSGKPCELVRSPLASPPQELAQRHPDDGFWFCRVETSAMPPLGSEAVADADADLSEVYAAVEARCPRFFPPGGGQQRQSSGIVIRYYPGSDVRLYVDGLGVVSYKYFRAINPTVIGSADDVRRGEFTIACDRLPGRYRLPWDRD